MHNIDDYIESQLSKMSPLLCVTTPPSLRAGDDTDRRSVDTYNPLTDRWATVDGTKVPLPRDIMHFDLGDVPFRTTCMYYVLHRMTQAMWAEAEFVQLQKTWTMVRDEHKHCLNSSNYRAWRKDTPDRQVAYLDLATALYNLKFRRLSLRQKRAGYARSFFGPDKTAEEIDIPFVLDHVLHHFVFKIIPGISMPVMTESTFGDRSPTRYTDSPIFNSIEYGMYRILNERLLV